MAPSLFAQLAAIAQPQTQAERHALISFAIVTLTRTGMPLPAAFDAILGEGQYDSMVSSLYDTFRSEA